MTALPPTPGWVCRSCVRGLAQQKRGLRVRARARPPPVEASRRPPTHTVTLTDGTTIRVQADRPQEPAAVAAAPTQPPPAPAEPPPTLPGSQRHDASTTTLVPSAPSSALAKPKSRTPPPDTPPAGPHDYNWYFETLAPTAAHTTHANSFFDRHGKHATLLRSIARFRTLPETDVPEVAFIGRSNVGKSSLLNAVMGCNTKQLLARTSSTPGFTKTMNLYGIGPEPGVRIATSSLHLSGDRGRETITGRAGLVIVDMPGYGAGSLASWGVEIMKYIQSRKALRRVFVLVDAEHGLKDKDRSILASLRLAGVSHQLVLSKADKLYVPPADDVRRVSKGAKVKSKGGVEGLRARMRDLLPDIRPLHGGAALGEILACSSDVLVDGKRMGVEHVRFAVLRAVGLQGEERKGFTASKKKMKTKKADA
ncbi:ribosome biogenesis GTP-binding protein YsxC [Stagonosporopsis vannaccii]|nr:ribosome biogenesis GTP-binding protein YsxC [Stagonosporopsis vannaccii]